MNLASPRISRRFPEFAEPLLPINIPVQRCSTARENASPRVLIVRTIANGDILMGSPLLTALRAAWPDVHLTWMVERREREIIDANPFVDELLLWDTAFWKRLTRRGLYPLYWLYWRRMRRLLREKSFDILISLQPEDWHALARDCGAPNRIGVFDTFREYHQQTQTSPRKRFYTHIFTHEAHPAHRTDQYLLPLRKLDVPQPTDRRSVLGWTDEDAAAVEKYIAVELEGCQFVLVAPIAGWPSRHWEPERYAASADAIARATNCRVVLIGGGSETDRATLSAVASRMQAKAHLAAGLFGFRALGALTARASLVLSGDTGPMHVAAAVDTPYVALFGPTPVERFAPLVGRGIALSHSVPCGPCHQKRCKNLGEEERLCLRKITVAEVVEASLRLLSASASPPSEMAVVPFGTQPLTMYA